MPLRTTTSRQARQSMQEASWQTQNTPTKLLHNNICFICYRVNLNASSLRLKPAAARLPMVKLSTETKPHQHPGLEATPHNQPAGPEIPLDTSIVSHLPHENFSRYLHLRCPVHAASPAWQSIKFGSDGLYCVRLPRLCNIR